MYGKFMRRGSSILSVAMISALALALVACGGGSGTPSSATTPTSTALVNIGDAPSDGITAFAMTVNSMTLNGPNGATTVMSTPTVVEMTRLMGAQQPLALLNIPQGTYASATINAGSAVVTFMNPTVTQQTVQVGSKTINFNPPMTVGATPVVFNFDMDLSQSVTLSGGNLTINPMYTASMSTPGTGNLQDPENGAMHVVGMVSGTPGSSSFGMSMLESPQVMNFITNGNTSFSNTSMGMMGNGQIVSVDAVMQPDGTMLAQDVRFLANAGGSMADGMMNSPLSGGSFTMMVQNGTGAGMGPSVMGNGITVNTTGATYTADTDGVDMTGLPFTAASFTSSTVAIAQRVQAISNGAMSAGSGMMGGMMNGGSMSTSGGMVRLVQQGFTGTVTSTPSGSPLSFTLAVPSDSAFTLLTGGTTMTVYQPAGAELRGLSSVANGAQIRVRGLLFHNSGAYQMVASRIMAP